MRLIFIAAPIFVLAAGCASYDAKTVNVQKPSVYAAHMVGDGFEIGAEAFDTDAKTKAAFDEKLVRKGVYPVQVVIENTSDKSLLIVRDQIELSGAVTNAVRPMSSTEVAEEVEANAIAHAIFGFGILSYAAAENANDEREADYTNKQLPQELVVRPGRMNGGFVFFRLPRGEKLAGKKLIVPVADASSATEPVLAEVDL
jgi:hypothetical protein